MPRVSVVIPAYNASRFVGEAIRSVLGQTYADFEVLVVDDGSMDDTAAVVRSVSDGRVRYKRQKNQGPSAARNTGIRMASGEYIGFLDADDLWRPEMLEACVSFLDGHPDMDVVSTRHVFIDEDGKPLPSVTPGNLSSDDVLTSLVLGAGIHTSSTVVRRECLESVGLWDEDLQGNTDWDLWLRVAAAGFGFGFVDRALEGYRRHEGNITLDYERMRASRLAVLDKLFSQPSAVGRIRDLKHQAYASAFRRSCIRALRTGLIDAATHDFLLAVERWPHILTDLSFYYQVACISVPIGYPPTTQNVDLKMGQRRINELVDCIESAELVSSCDRRRARATAHLALGMAYYAHASDMASAREHLVASLVRSPLNSSAWPWLARALIGRENVRRLRVALGRVWASGRAPRREAASIDW